MKLEVGMYVRTKYGITQYREYETTNGTKIKCMPVRDGSNGVFANIEDIKGEPSYNIIDLIEVGDYVNGSLVEEVGKDRVFTNVYYEDGYYNSFIGADEDWESCYVSDYRQEIIYDYEIKSIVTKEQFSSMEYKVGE